MHTCPCVYETVIVFITHIHCKNSKNIEKHEQMDNFARESGTRWRMKCQVGKSPGNMTESSRGLIRERLSGREGNTLGYV